MKRALPVTTLFVDVHQDYKSTSAKLASFGLQTAGGPSRKPYKQLKPAMTA
jgi:hypothetical protein